jgi:hypothetical protein
LNHYDFLSIALCALFYGGRTIHLKRFHGADLADSLTLSMSIPDIHKTQAKRGLVFASALFDLMNLNSALGL